MRGTNQRCNYCGQPLIDIGGIGGETELICSNSACPKLFENIKCPQCGSTEKSIMVRGLGDQLFKCNNCKKTWSSF